VLEMSCRFGRGYLSTPRRIESMPSGTATLTLCAAAGVIKQQFGFRVGLELRLRLV